jgi:NADH-quinone oxidoreductase subunit N
MFELSNLKLLLPAVTLAGFGMVFLMTEVFLQSADRRYQAIIALVGAALAFAFALEEMASPAERLDALGGAARADLFQSFVTALVTGGLFLTVLFSAGFLERLRAARGEYWALLFFAAAGMALLAMSADLVMIFVALETMSVATYALAAYLRNGQRPAEAAFKYFLLGAFSSALYIYGAALAYGAVGSTRIDMLVAQAAQAPTLLTGAASALLIAGFAFKVAAVPFHMWAPDVYEGAPTPVTAFMAVGVKAAAFAAFYRTVAVGLASCASRWAPLVSGLAALTMVLGNLLALPQRNVKRMLAYSSIAHAGYALLGLTASAAPQARGAGGAALLFYLASYAVSAVGAFGRAPRSGRSRRLGPRALRRARAKAACSGLLHVGLHAFPRRGPAHRGLHGQALDLQRRGGRGAAMAGGGGGRDLGHRRVLLPAGAGLHVLPRARADAGAGGALAGCRLGPRACLPRSGDSWLGSRLRRGPGAQERRAALPVKAVIAPEPLECSSALGRDQSALVAAPSYSSTPCGRFCSCLAQMCS